MARYEPLGNLYADQRLGSFEGIGNFGGALGQFDLFGSGCDPSRASTCGGVDASGKSICFDSRGCPTASTNVATGKTTSLVDPSKATAEQKQILTSFKQQEDTGISGKAVGNVLTGIGAILNPLAQAGVGIFSATQAAKIEKARLKASQRGGGLDPTLMALLAQRSQQQPQTGGKGVIIAAVLGGVVVLGVLVFALTR